MDTQKGLDVVAEGNHHHTFESTIITFKMEDKSDVNVVFKEVVNLQDVRTISGKMIFIRKCLMKSMIFSRYFFQYEREIFATILDIANVTFSMASNAAISEVASDLVDQDQEKRLEKLLQFTKKSLMRIQILPR